MSQKYIPKGLRQRISKQAKYRCGYCLTQEEVVGTTMEIDHLMPKAEGGKTEEENLWLACSDCNDAKNDRTMALDPLTGEFVTIFNPRTQDWHEHFKWTDEADLIIGLTEVGRATVAALNLNRPSLARARLRWVAVGWHPPQD